MLSRFALAAFLIASPALAQAETSASRAFIGDRENGEVAVIDLEARTTLAPLSLPGPVVLSPSTTASLLYATDREAGQVFGLATGLTLTSHGDHLDLSVAAPRVTGILAEGAKPHHLAPFAGHTAIFFDGEGAAEIVVDQDVLDGTLKPARAGDGPPHHGVAVVHHTWTAVTLAGEGPDGPVAEGVRLLRPDGTTLSETRNCPALHGEAAATAFVVFGCADGLLVVQPDGRFVKHAYPQDRPAEGRVWMTEKAAGFAMTVGDFGRAHLSVFTPDTGALSIYALAVPMVALALDPESGARVFVVGDDGSVRLVDALTGAERAMRAGVVTEMADLSEGSRLRPRIAVAGGHVLVTDPAKSVAIQLAAADLSEIARYDLGFVPGSVAAVAATGEAH
jgi:hypothetical protein